VLRPPLPQPIALAPDVLVRMVALVAVLETHPQRARRMQQLARRPAALRHLAREAARVERPQRHVAVLLAAVVHLADRAARLARVAGGVRLLGVVPRLAA